MSVTDDHRRIIFVWDLDETLILFNSLQSGAYPASAHLGSVADKECRALGEDLADMIIDFCDDALYFKQVGPL